MSKRELSSLGIKIPNNGQTLDLPPRSSRSQQHSPLLSPGKAETGQKQTKSPGLTPGLKRKGPSLNIDASTSGEGALQGPRQTLVPKTPRPRTPSARRGGQPEGPKITVENVDDEDDPGPGGQDSNEESESEVDPDHRDDIEMTSRGKKRAVEDPRGGMDVDFDRTALENLGETPVSEPAKAKDQNDNAAQSAPDRGPRGKRGPPARANAEPPQRVPLFSRPGRQLRAPVKNTSLSQLVQAAEADLDWSKLPFVTHVPSGLQCKVTLLKQLSKYNNQSNETESRGYTVFVDCGSGSPKTVGASLLCPSLRSAIETNQSKFEHIGSKSNFEHENSDLYYQEVPLDLWKSVTMVFWGGRDSSRNEVQGFLCEDHQGDAREIWGHPRWIAEIMYPEDTDPAKAVFEENLDADSFDLGVLLKPKTFRQRRKAQVVKKVNAAEEVDEEEETEETVIDADVGGPARRRTRLATPQAPQKSSKMAGVHYRESPLASKTGPARAAKLMAGQSRRAFTRASAPSPTTGLVQQPAPAQPVQQAQIAALLTMLMEMDPKKQQMLLQAVKA